MCCDAVHPSRLCYFFSFLFPPHLSHIFFFPTQALALRVLRCGHVEDTEDREERTAIFFMVSATTSLRRLTFSPAGGSHGPWFILSSGRGFFFLSFFSFLLFILTSHSLTLSHYLHSLPHTSLSPARQPTHT